MAVQKLVVFSECGPGKETIEHEKTGLLCNPYDENDIADKIKWALEHKNETNEIAKKAREHVLSNFNRDNILNKNIKFYNKIKA